jgi:hypothetical protein
VQTINQEKVTCRPGGGSLADLGKAMEKSMLRYVPKEWDSLTGTPVPESEANRAKRTAEQALARAPGRQPGSAYWLIARNDNRRLEVLTGESSGQEVLPVFSHEEEAEMFLRLGQLAFEGWQVRESTSGELISLLYGPCAGVERVALDPLPEMLAQRTVELVSLSRERFVHLVLSRERPLAPRERRSRASARSEGVPL